MDVILLEELDFYPQVRHRTKSHVSVFLKRGGNMQLHVSVMFNMHKKWSGSVVYAATETRENVTKPNNLFSYSFSRSSY